MSEQLQFEVDQKIVYPSQGVGTITEIRSRLFNGEERQYYVLYFEVSDMVIMVPVDKAGELGLRAMVQAEEAQAALEVIGEDYEPATSDWKLRYQMNMELLKKGTVKDIALIVRSLYHRSKVKELPVAERKLYDSAKKLLEDELSYALGLNGREAENMIHARLEPAGALHAARTRSSGEELDDEEFPDDTDIDIEKDDDDADLLPDDEDASDITDGFSDDDE